MTHIFWSETDEEKPSPIVSVYHSTPKESVNFQALPMRSNCWGITGYICVDTASFSPLSRYLYYFKLSARSSYHSLYLWARGFRLEECSGVIIPEYWSPSSNVCSPSQPFRWDYLPQYTHPCFHKGANWMEVCSGFVSCNLAQKCFDCSECWLDRCYR